MTAGRALLLLCLSGAAAKKGQQKPGKQVYFQNCAVRKLCNKPLEERDPTINNLAGDEAAKAPKGHLKPLGHPDFLDSWAGAIDEVTEMTPKTFWTKYWPKKPFILKGFAKKSPAFTKWRDNDYLLSNYGQFKVKCERKNEDRLTDYCNQKRFGQMIKCGKDILPYTELHMKLNKFMPRMEDPIFDRYIVTQMPDAMAHDFVVPTFHSCAKRDQDDPGPKEQRWMTQMYENNFWLSHNGGTNFSTSVIHYDMNHQIMCQFDGVKEWIMWDLSKEAQNIPLWSGNYNQKKHEAEGSDDSPIDGERVDLLRWPQFAKARWMNTTLEAGDCLYTPALLLHYVRSWGRNAAGMTMFHPEERYDPTCGGSKVGDPEPLSSYDVMWSFPEEDPSLLGWDVIKMGFVNWKLEYLWPLARKARQGKGGKLSKKVFGQMLSEWIEDMEEGKKLKRRGEDVWKAMDPEGSGSVEPKTLFQSKELRFLLKDITYLGEERDVIQEGVEVKEYDLKGQTTEHRVDL